MIYNTQLIASGPKEEIFVPEYLQKTYGGKIDLLTKVGEMLGELQVPPREK